MNKFYLCRTCRGHLGGLYSTIFFSWLKNKKYIEIINPGEFKTNRKNPILITSLGKKFFRGIQKDLGDLDFAFYCIDGTEKKPHLSGEHGRAIFEYLKTKKFISKGKNRIVNTTAMAEEFLIRKNLKEL